MADGKTFSIWREIARNEFTRHQARFIGVTTTVPRYIDQGDTDTHAHMEWVCDVRIDIAQFGGTDFEPFEEEFGEDGVIEPRWGLLRSVVISPWSIGAIADMNIPVLMERSEAGRISIIARSMIRLPDIVYITYSHNDLDFLFMTGLTVDADGDYHDAFGYKVTDPTTETGVSLRYTWDHDPMRFGSSDFEFGQTIINDPPAKWRQTIV